MKKLALLFALFCTPAFAAPHVISDPVASGTVSCGVFLDATPKVVSPVVPATPPAVGNMCSFDVSSVAPGTHTISMTAIAVNDPVWGTTESAKSSPLTFTRPTPPAAPTGLNLLP